MQSGCVALNWLSCFDLLAGQHQASDRSEERESTREAAAESLGRAETGRASLPITPVVHR